MLLSSPKEGIVRTWNSPWFWWILGSIAACMWWYKLVLLPPIFLGEILGDPWYHIRTAEDFTSLWDALSGTGRRAGIYTIFLFLHKQLFLSIGIENLVWLHAAKVSVLALHIWSSFFLYYAIRKRYEHIHPISLFLVLVHPNIVGMAVTSYPDSFVTSLINILFGTFFLLHYHTKQRLPLLFFGIGVLISFIATSRASHYLPLAICMLLLCIQFVAKTKVAKTRTYIVGTICCLLFGSIILVLPRLHKCYQLRGTICILSPLSGKEYSLYTAKTGLVPHSRFRYRYVKRRVNGSIAHLGDMTHILDPKRTYLPCYRIKADSTLTFITKCYAKTFNQVPTHLLHKFYAFFDEPWITYHGAIVTPDWVIPMKRVFGVLSFVAFFALIVILGWLIRHGKWLDAAIIPFVYILTFVAPMIIFFPILSRYGLPLYPLSIFSLFVVLHYVTVTKKKLIIPIAACAILASIYLSTVHRWDKYDYLMLPCIDEKIWTSQVYEDLVDVRNCKRA